MEMFSTVNIGIEDIAALEVSKLINKHSKPDVGRLFFNASIEDVYILTLKASMLNKIYILLCNETFNDLNDIYRLAKGIDYTNFIDPNQTFAIRSERVGKHNFTSIDISRVVGQAVIDSYLESKKLRLKVNLDEPDVEIYAFVRDKEFILGVNTTGESLHKRGYRVYEHPAALNPTIASAMLNISGLSKEDSLIDPMCGGGTIVIEAAFKLLNIPPNLQRNDFAFKRLKIFDVKEFEDVRSKLVDEIDWEVKPRLYAMEKYKKHLDGAIKNAEKAKVFNYINFIKGDARDLNSYPKDDITHVVVNPPYGIRLVPNGSPKRLYLEFINTLRKVTSNCILVLITGAHKKFEEVIEETNLCVLEVRKVLQGDLDSKIFKLALKS